MSGHFHPSLAPSLLNVFIHSTPGGAATTPTARHPAGRGTLPTAGLASGGGGPVVDSKRSDRPFASRMSQMWCRTACKLQVLWWMRSSLELATWCASSSASGSNGINQGGKDGPQKIDVLGWRICSFFSTCSHGSTEQTSPSLDCHEPLDMGWLVWSGTLQTSTHRCSLHYLQMNWL